MQITEVRDSGSSSATASFVEAWLNYGERASEKPFIYMCEPPAGKPRTNAKSVSHKMRIRNAREIAGDLSLDGQGFVLIHHETSVKDFYDQEKLERIYYREVEQLLKEATGAAKVLVFDHRVRNLTLAQRGEKNVQGYGKVVHNDYSAKSGPRRVRDHLPAEEAEQRLRRRFAEINVWRPIRGPVESTPLALCDARSIDAQDFVPVDMIYPDKVGETYGFTYNPNHRWFYFPRLEGNEVILLKCYDSKEDGRARFTPHSAFDDPTSPPHAATRESIEVRALVFWPDQG
jgi:hypothetical protein